MRSAIALYANPLWEFELTFDGLDFGASAIPGSARNRCKPSWACSCHAAGQFGTFLYTDPTDNAVVGAGGIATGDGATTTFTFGRSLGGFIEPVGWVTSVANVYLNGVNQASGWSLTTPNAWSSPPRRATASTITATFAYAFQCRFDARRPRLRAVHAKPVALESVKFRSRCGAS